MPTSFSRVIRSSLAVLASVMAAVSLWADTSLERIACRSVHLSYPAGRGLAFANEVVVDKSAPGTYFMVCGWDTGYFGLQELDKGKKVVIFSVWDAPGHAANEDERVALVYRDRKVRVGRFGGEGTGGQSFFDYNWKPGQPYRFLVTATARGSRTEYAGYFYVPEDAAWTHLVTFSTLTGGRPLAGYYSFVEDFKRDRVSATRAREAHFGNGWVRETGGGWEPLRRARFTADSNPVLNINAGTDAARFFLATGGETRNTGPRLQTLIRLPASAEMKLPADLPPVP